MFRIGHRVCVKYEKSYYMWSGKIFDIKRNEDGTAAYEVKFDDGDVDTSVKEHFIEKDLTVPIPPRPVSIMTPLTERKVTEWKVLHTFPVPKK
jgi:hypothetical protein